MSNSSGAKYLRGALYGLAAVSIWSGWIVVARLGLKTSLTPWDIAALRFAVAGLVLAPYLLRKGLALERLGWLDWRRSCSAAARPFCLRMLVCFSLRRHMRELSFPA
ncbi:MAG: hypothetical protein QOJ04_2653 [Caballeronia sp.]|nr:hypothetical protein [Caballeronia sp.]